MDCQRIAGAMILSLVSALPVLLAPTLHAGEGDVRLVAGLRERRLFVLAETYCKETLADSQLADIDRVELSVELMRTYAEHALNSRGSQRESLWRSARDVATAFDGAERPRSVLVRVQDALTLLARGELARMESEVAPQADAALTSARETLREAATLLLSLDRELSATIPIRQRNPPRHAELSAEELMSLQNHVRFQLARAYKNQALCFPAGSSDRTASLTAGIHQLEQPLLQLAPGQSLYVELRLEQIACLRLLGDADGAASYLKAISEGELSAREQLQVRAERIRWCLARSAATEALKVVAEGRKIGDVTSAELDFAFLETYARLWKSAADRREQEEVNQWRDKSVATAKFVEQEHGSYWARRAEILLVRIGAGSGDGSVDILRRTADDLYRKGKLDDAIAAYDKAALAATESGSLDDSFELAYKAALVLQQQQRYAEAADRFQQLALVQKTHRYAANSHLLAIASTRQASAAAGTWLDSYPQLLREHLANWPSSDTASSVAFWLGEFEASRHAWSEAIDAFLQVTADSAHYANSVRRLGECWLRRLVELGTDAPTQTEQVQRAERVLEPIILGDEGRVPTEWPAAAREAIIALATIRLQYGTGKLSETETLLRSSIAALPEPGAEWRVEAMSLLVSVIARQPGREGEAREMLKQVGEGSAQQLFALLQQIVPLAKSVRGSIQPSFAELVIDIAQRLDADRTELSDPQRLFVDQELAQALAAAGDLAQAYERWSEIAEEHPNNGDIQQAYAHFLLDSDDKAHWKQSLDQWRRVAARSRPRTSRWYRAKYSIALAQYKIGDRVAAAKLIRYLQATEDLAQSGLEERFAELLRQCVE